MQIDDILSVDRVSVGAEVTSKKAALETLARLVASASPLVTTANVFDNLVAREKLGSTGLGRGVAIPHGRVAVLDRAAGAFLTTKRPINFDAADGQAVDVFFALCVPEAATDEHLQILAQIAERFADEHLLRSLRKASTAAQAHGLLVGYGPRAG